MSWVLRTGVQETGTPVIDLNNCPAGAIRLMTNLPNEITGRANRTNTAWNNGIWPIPVLKTQTASTPAGYRANMVQFLDICAPAGGPRKTDVMEVGNEPQGDLRFYLDCLVQVAPLIRARGAKVVLAAMTSGATYTPPPSGPTIRGPAAVVRALTNGYRGANWSMIDGFALHNYGDSVADLINGWNNQRNMFPANKFMMITENGWVTGSGGPFSQTYAEPARIARILTMWPNILAKAEEWNLHCWSWFANADYGMTFVPGDAQYGNQPWDKRCGLVMHNGTRKSGAIVNWNGAFANGESFTQSWQALDRLPKETTIGITAAPRPTAVTDPADNLGDTFAVLHGTINPEGFSTTFWFEYGTVSGDFANWTATSPVQGPLAGSTDQAVGRILGGLPSSTTHYFRVVAENANGQTNGAQRSFTTAAASPPTGPPTVSTIGSSGVTETAATVLGTINPNGLSTTFWFEYGTSASLGTSTSSAGPLTGSTAQNVQANLSSLVGATTYHFRAVGQNSSGTTNGSILTFVTDSPPPISSSPSAVPSPPRLLEAIQTSHTLAVKAEVLRDGGVVAELDVIGGSVTYDAKASVRATLDLTIADDGTLGWIPNDPSDFLAPYGNEIRVWRGVRFDDGTEELVSLGIFRIDETEAQDAGDGLELRITGSDRAAAISDAKFEDSYNLPAGTPFTEAIRMVVTDAIQDFESRFAETEVTTPALVAEEGEDRLEFVMGLAAALKAELFFDDDGVLVLGPIPEATQDAVAELVEGEDGVLLEASKRWSRRDAFNKVIVTAENSTINPPARAEKWDDDPVSPTFYDPTGKGFGKVPRFYTNQFVTTQLQAEDTAEGILLAELGITQQVDFGAVVNPTLRASDVITIRRGRLGVSGNHAIDQLTIPLDAETSMTGQTRLVFSSQNIGSLAGHLVIGPNLIIGPQTVIY